MRLSRLGDSEAPGAPPMRPASETEWWGERKGRVVTSAAFAGGRPLIEWIFVHASASSKESGGRMVTIRFASILFPLPGGPTSSSTFGSEHLRTLIIQHSAGLVEHAWARFPLIAASQGKSGDPRISLRSLPPSGRDITLL